MDATKHIILNTIVQYIRTCIYMVLTLYSTRFILKALGESDFGLYSLIGSIVLLLGFITNSLASSTQRFLSYTHGFDDKKELSLIFGNAMFLHAVIASFLTILMVIIEPFMMNYLRIPAGRFEAGAFVYFMVTITISMTFITSPIRALFIARENIVFVSMVEIVDVVLRFAGAISLAYISYDSLKLYALLMTGLSVLNFLVYLGYASKHYEECHMPRLKEVNAVYLKKLAGFAVWNVYAVGSAVLRDQGFAVILNRFFGTLLNASYGIAQQISHAVNSIALSILNSVNPQLMKAEGRGDRKKMLEFATKESKYSFLVLSLLLIPVIIELPSILIFWLGKNPEYAVDFGRGVLIAIIIDQTTVGLTSANQAIGQIRNYSLLFSTLRLLVLPAAWLSLYLGYPASSIMCVYILFVILCSVIRLPYLHHTAGLDMGRFCWDVLIRSLVPIIGNVAISYVSFLYVDIPFRFILTECMGVSIGGILIYMFALGDNEKTWIQLHILNRFSIINRK